MSPRLITALVVIQAFTAFGVSYAEGTVVPQSDYDQWPEGTVERRLENKWVQWKPVHAEVDPQDPSVTIFSDPSLLESKSKSEIAKWALDTYGEEMAGNLDPAKLNKADLLLAVQTLIEEHGDPKA